MESGFVELKQNNNHSSHIEDQVDDDDCTEPELAQENVLESEKSLYKLQYELSTNAHMTP